MRQSCWLRSLVASLKTRTHDVCDRGVRSSRLVFHHQNGEARHKVDKIVAMCLSSAAVHRCRKS